MYLPTFWDLSHTIWASDEQGHGPIILAVSLWLLSQQRSAIAELESRPATALASGVVVLGLMLFVVGHTQAIIVFEVGRRLPYSVACCCCSGASRRCGWRSFRCAS